MKVVYFGKFIHSHSTENYVTAALAANGVEVTKVPCHKPMEVHQARAHILRRDPDFVLFAKTPPCGPMTHQLMNWCLEKEITTVCWQWDLFLGYRNYMPAQFWADICLTTDGGHDAEFTKLGINHSTLRQGIHKPEARKYLDVPTTHDVAFVGGFKGHPSRPRLISFLKRKYGDSFIHHTHTRGLALNEALAKVKIVVGDTYPSPNYWSNRIYEITGRGGFLLFPKTTGLETEFIDGVHYASYERDNFTDLTEKITKYLDDDVSRQRIQDTGWVKCSMRYTYEDRVKTLLSHVRAFQEGKRCRDNVSGTHP